MNKVWFDRLEEAVSRLSAIDEELAAPLVELMEERRNTIAMIARFRELDRRLGRHEDLTETEREELRGLRRWIRDARPLGSSPKSAWLQDRIEAFLNDYLPKEE